MNVKNPKEVGQEPFIVTCHGDERWNAIPSKRQALATTSAPDRLEFPADRPRSTQARGMSVRLVDRLFRGYPPERTQTSPGPAIEPARERTAGFPRESGLPGSSDHLAVDANDGVRKNTTRGVRVSESSAKANSSDLLRYRSERRWQHRRTRRDCDQPARHHRKVMQPDEENVGFPRDRVASAQELDTARSALHQRTRNRAKQRMERTRLRRYASAG